MIPCGEPSRRVPSYLGRAMRRGGRAPPRTPSTAAASIAAAPPIIVELGAARAMPDMGLNDAALAAQAVAVAVPTFPLQTPAFCSQCGHKFTTANESFCSHCGKAVATITT